MLKMWSPRFLKNALSQFAAAALFTSLILGAKIAMPQTSPPPNPAGSTILLPAGTEVTLALTNPILARNAKAGESVYAESAFPVAASGHMAIPSGTYVQGVIDGLKPPGWFSPHAQFQIHFTKIIFVNGYTVLLQPSSGSPDTSSPQISGASAPNEDVIAAVAAPYVQVSSSNDVLLDNGTQIQMVLQVPLALNAGMVDAAARRGGSLPAFRSATLCQSYPGTPDTVLPGTPGTPGTPPTVIPGGPGMPDTVIPGTPGTPGTPPTIISGSPGVTCPGPPVVVPAKLQNYEQSFQIAQPTQVFGQQLPAGTYKITWEGPGPSVQVEISANGNTMVSARGRMVLLNQKSPADAPETRINVDGSTSLQSLRFAGQAFALYFDQDAA